MMGAPPLEGRTATATWARAGSELFSVALAAPPPGVAPRPPFPAPRRLPPPEATEVELPDSVAAASSSARLAGPPPPLLPSGAALVSGGAGAGKGTGMGGAGWSRVTPARSACFHMDRAWGR